MEYIKKENGNVYLVKVFDLEGRHKTITYLGKEVVEPKPKEVNKPIENDESKNIDDSKKKKKEQE